MIPDDPHEPPGGPVPDDAPHPDLPRRPVPPDHHFALNPDLFFLDEIRHRPIWFTRIFLAVNVLVFVVMEAVGSTADGRTLVAFGAKLNSAIDAGEIWRFVTPMFIHIGIIHLAFNCYALWIVGQQVERLYGGARFVVFYVVMGIAGVLGSYFFNPDAISAGASGAIFGLFGVLLMFGIRNRRTVPGWLARAIGRGVLPVIVLNLVIGLAIPVVDNSAHVGGLISGMLLGGFFGFHPPGRAVPTGFRAAQIAALAIVAAAFAMIALVNIARI